MNKIRNQECIDKDTTHAISMHTAWILGTALSAVHRHAATFTLTRTYCLSSAASRVATGT